MDWCKKVCLRPLGGGRDTDALQGVNLNGIGSCLSMISIMPGMMGCWVDWVPRACICKLRWPGHTAWSLGTIINDHSSSSPVLSHAMTHSCCPSTDQTPRNSLYTGLYSRMQHAPCRDQTHVSLHICTVFSIGSEHHSCIMSQVM